MGDIKISHNLLKSEAIIVLNSKEYDQYGDAVVEETARLKKLVIVRKEPRP